ncbi:hypothetical protein SEA_CLOWN_69 [Gordonia phage Clown]|uniref:Uncharacterized protein n=1 Tax=Gordonia phage Clown TaxID=2759393 RepID=A0A7L7SPI4_9CAUD|nr:hypothetical protein KNV25_gp69 [Gordonia phage Clown]QOC56067.1 hypothetical protein SEA_CLOWN_69 [Gordonia phage Clown]
MTITTEPPSVVRQCPVCLQHTTVTHGVVRAHRDTAGHRCYMTGRPAPTWNGHDL